MSPAEPRDDDLWAALRQGARNVAGVRYQIAVTAHLLAESRAGVLPFVELIPEGYEDIDCLDGESLRWFVQAKEVGAGAGRFTVSSVAEVISHAAAAAGPSSRIVAVTDPQLGGQVVETGWSRSIADTPAYDVESTVQALVRRGHPRVEAAALATRSHLVRLPWNTAPLTSISIAASYGIQPAAAAIVTSRLLEDLAELAAQQRHTSADKPQRRVINDLDALVNHVMTLVDVEGLDTAVRLGICEIADYSAEPGSSRADFLLGVDAAPSHIGAHFDIIRPGPTRAVQVGLDQARYVLIAGPSGSGKSAQMWRSARDVAPGPRVVRVQRLETDDDVRQLVRHVQVLAPSEASAVIVCCDDLGRPSTARWPLAARRLLEQPAVLLIGAVRREDFTAELLRYGGELVELLLDGDSATSIAQQLDYAGVELALEVPEAVRRADGHLMEYIALLTTGKRMQAVLASQVESLLQAGDPAGASVTRIVCAAHVLGVGIDAGSLAEAVKMDRSRLTSALRRLQDEHIVTSDDRTMWRGLHQRRSDVLTELLHQTPPPTLFETMTTAIQSIHSNALGWCLRRMSELFPHLPPAQADTVRAAVSRCQSAAALAALLEGLERADHSLTALAYLPILERYRQRHVPLLDLAMLVCGDKFAGVQFGGSGDSRLDRMGRDIHQCAEELPNRSTTYCKLAATFISGDRLTESIVNASLKDAVRLLEAAALYVSISADDLGRVANAFPWPDGVLSPPYRQLRGRMIAACRLACFEAADFTDIFGSVSGRLDLAAESSPEVVSAVLIEPDRLEASLELLAHPEHESGSAQFAWDVPSHRRETDDATNRNAVELATFVGECCPELEVVEVRTILVDGSRFRIGDLEPGYKRLARNARPPRDLIRINVGIQAAISRQAAAHSWTELIRIRERAAVLAAKLTREAPRRLGSNDNPRRRTDWMRQLDVIDELLAQMPRPPAASELDLGTPAASWDAAREADDISVAVRSVAATLRMLVPQAPGRLVPAGAGDQARKSAERVEEALRDAMALTTADERRACEQLVEDLHQLRDLLVALAFDRNLSSRLRGTPDQYRTIIGGIIGDAATRQLERERRELEAEFAGILGAAVIELPDRDPFLTSIRGHQWLITVPPESWEAVARLAADRQRHIVDVPVSVVCELDEALLPIAARLSMTLSTGLVPLESEIVAGFASMLGKRAVAGPTLALVGIVSRELTLASWKNARARLRPRGWRTPEGTSQEHLNEARRLIDSAGPESRPVSEVLEQLVGRVADELAGACDLAPVAAQLARVDLFDSLEGDGSHAIVTVARAVLVALDVELERAVSE